MDEVVVLLRMSGGDFALIYQVARKEKKTVNEWIMSAILEKLERLQEKWRNESQKQEK
ncbi:MAG: hypothetical protein QXU69_04680 [Thermofilaceae archaeon]